MLFSSYSSSESAVFANSRTIWSVLCSSVTSAMCLKEHGHVFGRSQGWMAQLECLCLCFSNIQRRFECKVQKIKKKVWNVTHTLACFPVKPTLFYHSLSELCFVLSVPSKIYFIFLRREDFREGSCRARGALRVNSFAFWLQWKWGLVHFTMALFVVGGVASDIVAHSWEFRQWYLAWTIVLKFYICTCIVLWMYFLILTLNWGLKKSLSRLLFCLSGTFQGTRCSLLVQVNPCFDCTLLSCLHLKEQLCDGNVYKLSAEMDF